MSISLTRYLVEQHRAKGRIPSELRLFDFEALGVIAINNDGFASDLIVEAKLAGYALLGKEAPAFVALPALPVTRDTLLDGWKAVYSTEATDNIKTSLGQ